MNIRNRIKEFKLIPANELVAHEQNYRRHPPEQIKSFRAALNEIGFAGAVIVRPIADGKYQVLDGHLRSELLGKQQVPVLITDLTEEEGLKLLLTYDTVTEMAQIDKARMEALLAAVHFEDKNIIDILQRRAGENAWQATGARELADPPAQIDKAAELAQKWDTAAGQLWAIGKHRLLCADCRDEGAVGRLWADNGPKIRMIWCDPPYGVNYEEGAVSFEDRRTLHRSLSRPSKAIKNDALSPEDTAALLRDALIQAARFAELGAVAYIASPAGSMLPFMIKGMMESPFGFRHSLVWVKNSLVLGRADYHYRHETILYGWIENGPHYFTTDRTQDSVFEVDKPHVSDMHPTCKPADLIARMITNSSQTGDLIYDCFAGSHSTLIAAHQLNRICYTCELSHEYLAVGLERMSMLGLKPERLM